MAFTAGPAAASIETSQLAQPVMCISADPATSSFRRAALQLRPRLGEFYPMRLRGGSTWLPSCIRPRAVATADAAESVSGASRVLQSPADRDKPQVVFILGGPGAGKGTQCGKLVEDFRGVKHLSAGDLLRAERSSGSEQGEMIDRYMAEGKIIPVEVTARLLKEAIDKDKSEVALFLIDGFPRNADNLDGWERIVGDSVHVQFMLFMECSEEVMTQRLLSRGATSGRIDDNAESIKKRFRTYQTETMPVILQFEQMDKLRRIDSGEPVPKVYSKVRSAFEPIVEVHSPPPTPLCVHD